MFVKIITFVILCQQKYAYFLKFSIELMLKAKITNDSKLLHDNSPAEKLA